MAEKGNYTPDMATFLRESSKEELDAKLKKALDNPHLDAALNRVRPKLKPGEDPLFYDVNRPSSPSLTDVTSPSLTDVTPVDTVAKQQAVERAAGTPLATGTEHAGGDETAAPRSPWATTSGAAELDLDRDALPSAHLPPAAPPTSVPIPRQPDRRVPPSPQGAGSRRRLASVALAVLALLVPLTIAVILSRATRPNEHAGGAPTASSTTAATPPSAPTTRPPAAPPTSTTATSTAPPVPPAVVDGGGAIPVQPAPSSAPTQHPAAPVRAPLPTPTEDPYPSPPTPPATVAPAPPPTAPPPVTPITPAPTTSVPAPWF
jgi:hypothetical protein